MKSHTDEQPHDSTLSLNLPPVAIGQLSKYIDSLSSAKQTILDGIDRLVQECNEHLPETLDALQKAFYERNTKLKNVLSSVPKNPHRQQKYHIKNLTAQIERTGTQLTQVQQKQYISNQELRRISAEYNNQVYLRDRTEFFEKLSTGARAVAYIWITRDYISALLEANDIYSTSTAKLTQGYISARTQADLEAQANDIIFDSTSTFIYQIGLAFYATSLPITAAVVASEFLLSYTGIYNNFKCDLFGRFINFKSCIDEEIDAFVRSFYCNKGKLKDISYTFKYHLLKELLPEKDPVYLDHVIERLDNFDTTQKIDCSGKQHHSIE